MSDSGFQKTITVAITGASGAQYGLRLLQLLVNANCQVLLMVSSAAQVVIRTETDWPWPSRADQLEGFLQQHLGARPGQVRVFSKQQWMAPVASGSGAPRQMVVCPCSTGMLSAIATGACNNLMERAADVVLKERAQLILVTREAPLSEIHLEHMLKLTRMGAIILPASPGFYNGPKSIDDLVDFVVARIMNQLQLKQELLPGWGAKLLLAETENPNE